MHFVMSRFWGVFWWFSCIFDNFWSAFSLLRFLDTFCVFLTLLFMGQISFCCFCRFWKTRIFVMQKWSTQKWTTSALGLSWFLVIFTFFAIPRFSCFCRFSCFSCFFIRNFDIFKLLWSLYYWYFSQKCQKRYFGIFANFCPFFVVQMWDAVCKCR